MYSTLSLLFVIGSEKRALMEQLHDSIFDEVTIKMVHDQSQLTLHLDKKE